MKFNLDSVQMSGTVFNSGQNGGMTFLAAAIALFPGNAELDAILDHPDLRGSLVSACVINDSGEVLYARNESMRAMPASNQKTLSVAFALWKLGPTYTPITRIWKVGQKLIVDSPGDPSLTADQLLAAKKKLGIGKSVPIYVRQAYSPLYGPGWEWDDLPNRYAPAITAFTVDKGSFELWAGPRGPFIKGPATLGVRISRVGGQKRSWAYNRLTQEIIFRGPVPDKDTFLEAFALLNPVQSASRLLGGTAYPVSAVPETPPTLTLTGKTVGELAPACLVPSDNFHAESLLLMAASKEKPLGKDDAYGEAAKQLKSFLVDVVKCEPAEFDPYDGSGLSRHNNVTARGLTKLLFWAKQQPFGELYKASMAKPGNGTLANRLEGSSFRGKTGTLNKVVSLSGYVKLKDGREVIASVIINNFIGSSATARNVADSFVRKIEEGSGFGTKIEN